MSYVPLEPMAESPAVMPFLVRELGFIHSLLIGVADDVDERLFHARPGPRAPAMAFHLWHMGRWADLVQGRLAEFAPDVEQLEPREQIWVTRDMGRAWGMEMDLGWQGAGTGLDDDASAAIPLPEKRVIGAYSRDAFDAVETVLAGLRNEDLFRPSANPFDEERWPLLQHFTFHFGHGARHLGMMEAIKGVLGMRGTATR